MSLADQVLPEASVTELAAAQAFAATGLPDVPVFLFVSPRGPLSPKLLGAGDIATLVSTYGTGPGVKETAFAMTKIAQPVGVLRVPTASVPQFLSTPAVVKNVSSNFTSALSGTALDSADILITFTTVGGQTGTGPISYTLSTNGGGTTGAPVSLGTATTIVVLGVTITLGSAKTITVGDTVAWYQIVASASVLPLTFLGTGTSVITITGTPLDAYELGFRVVNGGTIGVAGITYQLALDYGAPSPTWGPTTALGTATTLLVLDGPISTESTGLTLNFAAGTLVTGDVADANTTAPAYNSAGLVAGLALLASWNQTWTWVRAIGPVTESIAATADSILLGWDTSVQPSWMVVDARDRGTTESLAAWSGRLQSDYAPYVSTRVAVAAGMARVADPVNGRNNRRSAMCPLMPRAMGAGGMTIASDWAQYDAGPLDASVDITDINGTIVEHNANQDPSLNAMGFVTLRTWPGQEGIFPTRAALMGPDTDIKLIPLRRVMNVAKKLEKNGLLLQVCKTFRQWTSAPGALAATKQYKAGDIYEPDARKIERIINDLLTKGVLNLGYVSAINFVLKRTPISLGGGSNQILGAMQLTSLLYVAKADATAQFVGAVT